MNELFLMLLLVDLMTSLLCSATPLDDSGLKFRLGSPDAIYEAAELVPIRLSRNKTASALKFAAPLRQTLEEIQEREGFISCDCALFVQAAAMLLSEEGDSKPGLLLTTVNTPPGVVACACGHELAYFSLSDISSHLALQNTSFRGKGHWLYPVGPLQFLGILEEGPVQGSIKEWRKWAKEALLSEYKDRSSCEQKLSFDQTTELRYLSLLKMEGSLENWTLHRIKKSRSKSIQESLNNL